MLQLLAFKEQTSAEEPVPKTSIAAVLRIVRSIMNKKDSVPRTDEALNKKLEAARIDAYERHSKKKRRNYPRRKEEPSTGTPKILIASETQRQKLCGLTQHALAA